MFLDNEPAWSPDGTSIVLTSDEGDAEGLGEIVRIAADGSGRTNLTQRIDCGSLADIDVIEETVVAGSSSLTYHPETGRYHYVWKTGAAWAGTCRRLVIGLVDGSFHRADFKF